MPFDLRLPSALVLIAGLLAACSGNGLQTSSITAPEPPRIDPACSQLAATVDGLKREGVADKVEKAAAKKYKMTSADLVKAAQLNKANDEFQFRCSKLPRDPVLSTPAVGDGGLFIRSDGHVWKIAGK